MAKKIPSLPELAEEPSCDRNDLAILRILRKDSRTTLQDIAAQVGLSPTTCWTRIKRLETSGVIRRYTIDIDESLLGYRDTVLVQVTLESHTDETLYAFGRALAAIPEVQEAYLVSGDYDYVIRIAVRSTRDYERLLREQLYKIPGIRHSKSSFVLRVLKEATLPID
jgi:Lrp/AsnC family leucine-responsive transcriptional regulator